MNALRLFQPVDEDDFRARTGLSRATLAPFLTRARERELVRDERLQPTELGYRFLDDLLALV